METRTAAIVAKELQALDYEVKTGISQTGVVGIMRNGDGSTVMYRADTDALPVEEATGLFYASTKRVVDEDGKEVPVSHVCGHDAHTIWMLGLAKATEKSSTTPLVNDAAAIDGINPQLANLVGSDKLLTSFTGTTGSEDAHLLKGDYDTIQFGYIFVGVAEPALFAEAQAESKTVPFSNHNPNFQVDLNAIPFGTKVAAVMTMDFLQ